MKKIRLFLVMALAALSFSAEAQIDYNDPQWAPWGETAEARQANMLNSSFLKEAIDNKDYDSAAKYLNLLINDAPKASHTIYARGILLYRNKVNRARSLSEKNMFIDSVLLLHDLRLEHFADHATAGAPVILDSKARMYVTYKPKDREGLREVFKAAIESGGQETKPDLVCIYFQNLCDDYQMDEVMADEVLAEYDRLTPYFEALGAEGAEYKEKFDGAFGLSGAASCENLEALFSEKLAAAPEDVDLLTKAVSLMDRAKCNTPFYTATAEQLYAVRPTANAAMALASIFQNEGDYEKASKYLFEALAVEEDVESREALLARISLVQFAAEDYSAALKSANESISTDDGTLSDNGVALFVKAQCYARSIGSCGDFACLAVYWAAYDVMNQAIANFTADESAYVEPAKAMAASYRSVFPTQEECFFNEVNEGSSYRVSYGAASGVTTTVRYR
ncbi:MAG: tetratricopeptide repeat protein [Rikenellaceae bacterium]